jgi:hypothetical protein
MHKYTKRLICLLAIGVVMQSTSTFGNSPDKPFQAEYELTRKIKFKDDRTVIEQLTGRIYRDSKGRERIDEFTQDEHTVRVYDPPRKSEFMLDIGSKTILYQVPFSPDGFRAYVWNVNKSAIAFPLRSSQSVPALGWKDIEGVQCAGYQIQKPGEYTVQYWISGDLDQLFLVQIVGEEEEITWRLFNLEFIEPDVSYFDIPGNFIRLR